MYPEQGFAISCYFTEYTHLIAFKSKELRFRGREAVPGLGLLMASQRACWPMFDDESDVGSAKRAILAR